MTASSRTTTSMPRPRDTLQMGNGEPPAAGPGQAAAPAPEDPELEQLRFWGTPLPTQGRPRRRWREQVRSRAAELAVLGTWMAARTDLPSSEVAGAAADAELDKGIRGHLRTAEAAARGVSLGPSARGARMERAYSHLDDAEADLLRRAPDRFLRGELPSLLAHVAAHLPPAHPERVRAELLAVHLTVDTPAAGGGRGGAASMTATAAPIPVITDTQRTSLVAAHRTASAAARREHTRLRSFRTVVALTALALLLLAVGIGVLGALQPRLMPLCFAPQGSNAVVCPTKTAPTGGTEATPVSAATLANLTASTAQPVDIGLIMLIGLAGAAVTGAVALRRMRGTSTPFAVPATLLVLKLPTGAMTAFLGLILLHGDFVPGLSALDSSDQILAWALLFGAAQQLVTGLVDKKAQSVLDSVGSNPMTAEHE